MSVSYLQLFPQWIALLLVGLASVCQAQRQNTIDSLRQIAMNERSPDSSRISALIDLTYEFTDLDVDSMRYYHNQLVRFSKRKKSNYGMVWANKSMSDYFYNHAAFDSVIHYEEEALQYAYKLEDTRLRNILHIKLTSDYLRMLKYDRSLDHIYDLKQLAETENDMRYLAIAYSELGYHSQVASGDFAVAMRYYQMADSILTANDIAGKDLGNIVIAIGHLYLNSGIYDKAQEYFERARSIYETSQDEHNVKKIQLALAEVAIQRESYGEAEMLLNGVRDYFELFGQETFQAQVNLLMGEAQLRNDFPSESVRFFEQSYDLREKIADTIGMIENLILLSEAHFQTGDLQKSEQYVMKAVKISKEAGSLPDLVDSYRQLSKIFRKQNDLSAAFEYLQMYTVLNDSLRKIRNVEELQSLEARYQTKKKEAEIEMLTLENQLASSELERKKAVQTRLIILLLLLAMCSAFLWFWMRTKRKLGELHFRQEMQRKNDMIDGLQQQLDQILSSKPDKTGGSLIGMEELNQLIQFPLSEREYDVLVCVAEGHTNVETSEKLFISQNTVKFHLKNIYNKLDVSNRVQALNMMQKN